MMKNIEISTVEPNIIKVELAGKLYVEEATELRETLIRQVDKGVHTIYIEMSDLDYIDSSGLGVLIAIHKRCLQKNGGVKIRGLRGNIKELFELTRLNKVFEIQ